MNPIGFPSTGGEAAGPVDRTEPDSSPMDKHLVQVDHIAVAVSDLEQAERWYTEVLGFRCVERRAVEGIRSGMISAVMKAGPVVFVLIQGTNPNSQVSRFIQHYGQGVQHIALQVQGIEQLLSVMKGRALDFSTSLVESPGLRQVFTRRSDRTGLMLEFIERGNFDGFTQTNVRSLFSQLEAGDDF